MGHTLDQVFNFAVRWANKNQHEYLTLELILYSLLEDPAITETLQLCQADVPSLQQELQEFLHDHNNFSILEEHQVQDLNKKQFADDHIRQIAKNSGIFYQPEPTMALQRVLQRAAMHLQSSEKREIHSIHLLIALFGEEEAFSIYILHKHGVTKSKIVEVVAHGVDKATNVEEGSHYHPQGSPLRKPQTAKDFLAEFTCHLNQKAREGKLDPLVGRRLELKRIIQILCRRRKNNPLLVGDAGVGKTALAEGLALEVENNKVPDLIKDLQIYSLDMGALLSGTKYRGDFEARFKNLIKALCGIEKDTGTKPLLFIDEIHCIMGASAANGAGTDASNMLKPLLSSGEIRCMGSSTYEEMRKFLEKDSAFARRFQKLEVEEPSEEEACKILTGLKPSLEKHHHIKFPPSTIKAAVKLSSRYISDRKLPDKAIDVIDEVGSLLQLQKNKKTQASTQDVENIVAQIAKIPRQTVGTDEKNKIKNLDRDLKMLIFGQDHAIDRVCRSIILSRSGLQRRSGLVASFLFAGPTGVGKTELAKQLAYHLGISLHRVDMSEYIEKHSVSKLIGAPPGYVGHDQGGLLTEAINKNPYSIILLDEIEKAHPDILNILLQMMDYGKLTDSSGRSTDCQNCILIMTTNAGAKDAETGSIGLGEECQNNDYKRDRAIKNFFSPEFRNRLDQTIHFHKLHTQTLDLIVDKFINETKKSLQEKNIELIVTKEARQYLGERGYDSKLGARPIKRLIEEEINTPLSQEILFGKLQKNGCVRVDLKNNKIIFSF